MFKKISTIITRIIAVITNAITSQNAGVVLGLTLVHYSIKIATDIIILSHHI